MPTTLAAKELDSSKPNYIVIFREPSEGNTGTLAALLNRGAAKGMAARKGVNLLAAGASGVVTRVFERIGVAATDLTDSQAAALKKREDVQVVAVNQVRYLPPVRKSAGEGEAEAGPGMAPIQAYLRGMRDSADLALSFLEPGRREPAPAGPGLEAVTPLAHRVTWGLRAVGVGRDFSGPSGRGVRVAVLDTGIDLQHPDMGGKVIEGQTAVSLVTGVGVQDVNGHGTHVAGTIAGPSQSVRGLRYAVAPDVELLVGKVFNNRPRPSATDDDILEGIMWADENGARVISMSLGSDRNVDEPFADAYETLASQLLNRPTNSVVIIAAAGNESERPFFTAPVGNPAACPSIMAVAAVDRFGRVAEFSCRQMDSIGEVNVSGPGVSVYSSTTGGAFEVLDGTSMATPHVSGIAALYLEQTPGLTAQQLFQQLQSRARPLGASVDFGAGLVRI